VFVEILLARNKSIAKRYLFEHSGRAAAAVGRVGYFINVLRIAMSLKLKPTATQISILFCLLIFGQVNWLVLMLKKLFNRK
jgi:hypothetical protein